MGKTSQKKKEKRLAGQVSLALAAGMFSALPVAHGMPTLDPAGAHKDYETPSIVDKTMSVTGTGTNNVIDWKDFSVKADETVAFQKVDNLPANYMNIVTGNATSNIEGRITNAGDIYLINPHGVIFGKGAKVDVGNLYVSTRDASNVDIAGFKGGTASGESVLSVAASPTTDVVNLIDSTTNGYVRANKVVMEGRNIRFLDSSSVIQAGTGTVDETTGILTGGTANAASANLVLRSNTFDGTNGYIHVGDASGDYVYTTNKKNGNTPVIGNVGNTGNDKKEKEDRGVVNYALVRDAAGLNSINNNGGNANSGIGLAGNYMLADDITNAGTVQIGTESTSGTGNAFTGKFDGMFNTVSGLSQSSNNKYLGLFGHTSEARIENVGVKNARLNGSYAGSIVGYAENNTILLNVWNEGGNGSYVGLNQSWGAYTGGLVGYLKSSTLKNSYNSGTVYGAGIVSRLDGGIIADVFNTGFTSARSGTTIYGIAFNADGGGTITNAYTAAKFIGGAIQGTEELGKGNYTNSYVIKGTEAYNKDKSQSDISGINTLSANAYGSWSISNEGGADTIWRIYEGESLPLLNSFMKAKGTVAAEYTYDKNGVTTQSVNDASSKVYSATKVAPTDIVLYGANGAAQQATDGTAVKNLTGTQFAASTRKDVYTGSGTTATKFALLYGGQQGYDLYGNNFTINKRAVAFSQTSPPSFSKMYDGNSDATGQLEAAIKNASSSSTTGFIENDADYVTLTLKTTGEGDKISATYGDRTYNTQTEQWEWASNQNAGTRDIYVTGASSSTIGFVAKDNTQTAKDIAANYTLDGSSAAAMNGYYEDAGTITKRAIKVSLYKAEGIDKVYDGTASVHGTATVDEQVIDLSGSGNLKINVDDEGLGATSEERAAALAALLAQDFEGGVALSDGVAANYVSAADEGGNRALTSNVADTADSTNHVAYGGIKLSNNNANYQLTDSIGTALTGDDTNGYTLLASGKITPRKISASDLSVDGEYPLTKTYDGTSTKSVSTTTPATFTAASKVTSETAAKSSDSGILQYGTVDDASKLTFTPTGTATFFDSTGNQTSTATQYDTNGTTVIGGADRAKYNVTLSAAVNDPVLTNYVWDNGNGTTTALSNGSEILAGGAAGSGVINKRNITVTLGTSTGIDKTYDGTADVGSAYTTWNGNYAKYVSTNPGNQLVITADETTGTTASMSVAAVYAIKDGHGETNAQDVALDSAGNVLLNNAGDALENQKNVIYTLTIDGDLGKNYTINGEDATTGATLTGQGRIKQQDLTELVSFTKAEKYYDGDSTVDVYDTSDPAYGTVRPTLTVTGWTEEAVNAVFDKTKIGGTYGTGTGTTFEANANASDTNGSVEYFGWTTNAFGDPVAAELKYALKSKNYKVSNTIYGAGQIKRRNITLNDLKTWTSPTNNTSNSVTAEYAGKTTYGASEFTAQDYINTGKMSQIVESDRAGIAARITIAQAIFNDVPDEGGTLVAGDAGTYEGKVNLKFSFDGANLDNYIVEYNTSGDEFTLSNRTFSQSGYNGIIDPKGLTVTVANASKIYDGTTNVKANGVVFDASNDTFKSWFTFTGMVDNETVTLANGATATYDNENADVAGSTPTERITYSGLALADGTGKASNYKIVNSQGATINSITGIGTINKRSVMLSDYGVATATKAYDGDADVKAYALKFADVTQEGTADKSVLCADGITDASGKIVSNLTGTYLPTGSQTQGQGKDVLRDVNDRTNILVKNVEYIDTEGGTTPLANLFGGNYNVTLANGGSYDSTTGKLTVTGGGKISPKKLYANDTEVVAGVANKIYDRTTDLENAAISYLTFSNSDLNTYKNDVLTVTGEYDSKDASENRTVTYTLTMKSGGVADNFDLDGDLFSATTGTATKIKTGNTIAKKIINAVIDPTVTAATQQEIINKVYDGGMAVEAEDAETAKAWLKLDGVISGDTVSVDTSGNGFSITYKDKTVATSTVNDKVTYSGFGLKDTTDAGNYELASTTLSGYGTITPKDVNFNIEPVMNKYYDGGTGLSTAAQSGDAGEFAANSTTLAGAVTTWKNANIVAGDDFNFSGLTGVYGSWSPSGTAGTFTENSHVNPTGGVPETKDVLYTFNVTGTDVGNYRLLNGSGATLKAEDNTITNTAYFHAAQEKGQIYPLAISMSAVKNQWGTIGKVYDGNNLVASNGSQHVYDVNGVEITDPTKFLTIYYNKDGVDGYNPTSDIPIAYNVASAIYGNKNAGDQTVTYSGFTFSSQSLGDYVISGGDLDSTYNDASNPVTHTGNIARRLLVVDATSDPSNVNYRDHTKTYDGNEHSLLTYIKNENGDYVANPLAYTVAAQSLQNDNGTGRVGNDKVSVTYVANFKPTGTWDAEKDVNITDQTAGTYTHKNVTYTFTLSGDDAANYTIVADKRTVGDGGTTATATQQGVSAIKPREVYVDFATDNADVYQGEGLDKIYDGDASLFTGTNNETSLLASGKSVNDILTLVGATNDTGIVAGEGLTLDTAHVTANYVDSGGNASADSDAKLGITTRKVYIQNLNLTGTDNANNYVVKAVKKQGDTQGTDTLEGKGSVAQRQVTVKLNDTAPVTKVYDKTESLKGYSVADITTGSVTSVPASGIVTGDNLGLSVESAIYYDYDQTTGKPQPQYGAKDGLGVSYRLKWSNTNYTLVKVSMDELADKQFVKDSVTGNYVGYGTLNTDSVGTITPRTLTYKDESSLSVDKTYDGTTDVKDASAVATGIFAYATAGSDTGLVAGDEKDLLTTIDTRSHYDSKNTGATAATGIQGTPQKVTLGFTVNNNYRLDANNNMYDQDMNPIIVATGNADANGYKSGTYTGPGRIDRALVTMTPTEVSYYPSQLANAAYSGSASGFVNGDARPAMTFGRDGNTATAAGNYTLLGYVNGTRIGTGDTFVDGVENYYFKTTPNTYLHILAEPVNPDVPVIPDIPDIPGIDGKPVTQAVTETVISDKKFTPDEFSYARISKDQDPTHMVRESSAALQYSEKGVNLDGGDTKSGLAALADIKGAGSVVNLEGAFIRTSAPAEQPEMVAAEAALPVPETEESDISSISLEYAGDGDNSQALLEILTNASSNAEKKGTSIVIDAQDEDEEDAKEEKSRRAIFADRSNIGIETLGNAVNLNQMIG